MIFPAMIEAARMMEGLEKGGTNTQQNFKFRGIEQLTQACAPIFKAVGVVAVPSMEVISSEVHTNRDGKPAGYRVVIAATYTFYAEDGSSMSCTTIGEGIDSYDKATNKAMSGAFKYALLQALCIGDPQDDSDATGEPREDRPQRTQEAAPAASSGTVAPSTPAVSSAEWKAYEALRAKILASDDLRAQFGTWVSEVGIKVERDMPAEQFAQLLAKAQALVS